MILMDHSLILQRKKSRNIRFPPSYRCPTTSLHAQRPNIVAIAARTLATVSSWQLVSSLSKHSLPPLFSSSSPLSFPSSLSSFSTLSSRFFRNIGKRNMCVHVKARTRVLFCGPQFPDSYIYTKEYLKNYPSIQVDDLPFDSIPDHIGNYDMCLLTIFRLNSEVIARATRMKLIMQFGVGLEGVDIAAATDCGIKVARIPSGKTGNAVACAEMAIYLMFGLLRKQNEIKVSVMQKKVGEPTGNTLLGKTVFIMGYGNIGIELAKRLRPFGVKILATKRSWNSYVQNTRNSTEPIPQNSSHKDLVDEKGSHEDIYEFAKMSDIVVCCLSMNSETAGIVNKNFLSLMRKGGMLVNIARGGVLDYEAVHNSIKSGHLGGLAMDVAWSEPFNPDDPLLNFPNVLLTPHVAGVTECSFRSMAKVVGDVALQLHSGKPLSGIEYVN